MCGLFALLNLDPAQAPHAERRTRAVAQSRKLRSRIFLLSQLSIFPPCMPACFPCDHAIMSPASSRVRKTWYAQPAGAAAER